ncbi:MAG: molybdopterin dehydrogenase [Clostridia bacterium]|nr:molybdopterin dehydrogenase [Clostridia bacterium]
MKILDYAKPQDLEEALSFLSKAPEATKILAGGTDLIIQLRSRETEAEYILDLGGLEELKQIRLEGENIILGSMTTFTQVEEDPIIRKHVPVLAAAAGSVGSPQIRNRGTVGGNIANAAVAADSVPALMALDAKVKLVSTAGERVVELVEVPVGLNKTSIRRDEILTEIIIPVPKENTLGAFIKIGRRKAMAIARLNLALQVTFEADRIASARLALGAVGTTAYRVPEVEELLAGQVLSAELVDKACKTVNEVVANKLGSRPTAPYKKTIAAAALRRAFARLNAAKEGGAGR